MKTIKYTLLFIIFYFTAPSHAFDLWGALQSAKNYSEKQKAAKYELDARFESAIQAKAQLMPQINASTSYNDRAQSNFDSYETYGWDIKLSQPLYDKKMVKISGRKNIYCDSKP